MFAKYMNQTHVVGYMSTFHQFRRVTLPIPTCYLACFLPEIYHKFLFLPYFV